MQQVTTHYNIDPIKIYMDERLLTGKEKEHSIISGKIIALDIYEEEAISFTVLFSNGVVYNYIPVNKVFWKKEAIEKISHDLNELVYHNSPSNEVSLDCIEYLKNTKPFCYIKQTNLWIKGEYIFSVDWYKGNDLLNFMKLEDGSFAFLPNHKILFREKEDELCFPDYKKARWENKV